MFLCSLRYFANVPLFPKTPGRPSSLLVLLHQQKRDDKNARFIVNCSVTCDFFLLLSTKSEKLFAFMKNKSGGRPEDEGGGGGGVSFDKQFA